MKYLVTGGAGFIGSHLAEELARNHEVIILDDLSSGKMESIQNLLDRGVVSFVKGSITDPALLRTVFTDIDGVFHEAAVTSVPRSVADPVRTNEVNIGGTLNVLMAAREAGVQKVVFASSSSVYGDTPTLPTREDMNPRPQSPYAVSKVTGEYYCQVFSYVFDLPTVCLRYFNVYGPRQDPNSEYAAVIPKFITRALEGTPPVIYGDGLQTRDFTYVRDVVKANILAMQREVVGTYNIACSSRITLLDLAARIMKETHGETPPEFKPPRPGDVRHSLADISSAKKAFGYEPEYSLQEGLHETIAWYRGRYPK